MGRSTVEKLPAEIRTRLEEWLREFLDGRLTLDDVMTRLDGQFADQAEGVELPSRSAVHRHAQNFRKISDRIKRSREISEQLIAQAGPDIADGKAFQVLVQGFQSLVFDLLANIPEDGTLDPENLMFLAKSIQAVTSARKSDADLHEKLKAEARKEAAQTVKSAAGEAGLSDETARFIMDKVLGKAA